MNNEAKSIFYTFKEYILTAKGTCRILMLDRVYSLLWPCTDDSIKWRKKAEEK